MNTSVPMIKIGELVERNEAKIQTGPFGTQLKASEYVDCGIPVINVRNVGFGDIRDADLEYVTNAKAEKLGAHRLEKGDIVFGRKGAVERHALIGPEQDGWVQGSDCLRLRLNGTTICERYASYYLRTRAHQDWMQALCSFGATMASLNHEIVKRITLPLPTLTTQRKIAAILTAYDDLIEVNKRRIALLEKMAEELYREWFVRLRFPGYQDTRFVKGVPEGWELKPLSDLGTFLNGYAFKPSHWGTEGVPIIKIKEMSSGITAETPRNSGDDIPSKYHFDDGAIIFSWSGTLLVRNWDEGPGLLNQHLFKVEPRKGIPHSFLFHALAFSIPLFEVLTTGATMQHIKRKELSFVKVMVPPSNILKRFDDVVGPIVDSKLKLKKANRNLTKTRDLLLPHLISGKLSVEDLDIQFPPSMQEGPVEQASPPEARPA